jgi:phosphopantothenoylcysteine synthetase/decarboxylase
MYVVVCGAGAAIRVDALVGQAQQRGWDVFIIASPAALQFINVAELEEQTAHAVRSDYQTEQSVPRSLPHATVIVVAPATYNTINKWAHGVSDTYALSILAESIGLRIPVVVLPFVNSALASHFAFGRSVRDLRAAGVRVILGPGEWEPHPPGTGSEHIDTFPWHLALDEADRVVGELYGDRPSVAADR